MLSRVEVHTRQGSILDLPLDDPSGGIIVTDIEGLDPVNATLVSSSFANVDGEQYHSARREKRNIKLKLGLEPDYVTTSVSDLRKRLYAYLMPKAEVMLRFLMTDGQQVDIWGRVESNEAPQFVQEPAADVSILCFNPDFFDPTIVNFSGTTTSTTTETLLTYDGTVETGFLFTLLVNRSMTGFTIYHRPPDGSLRLVDFAAPLVAGDELLISSVTGAKGAFLTHLGSDSSVLYGISPQSPWLQLENGVNGLRVYASGAGVPYTIQYTTKYGGL